MGPYSPRILGLTVTDTNATNFIRDAWVDHFRKAEAFALFATSEERAEVERRDREARERLLAGFRAEVEAMTVDELRSRVFDRLVYEWDRRGGIGG